MWDSMSSHLSPEDEEALNELTEQLSSFNWKESVVDKAKRLLYSNLIEENIKGATNLKAMLCIGRDEVYEVAQEVIDAGVIVRLSEFLRIDNRDLQYPAAFCLTNVAAGHDDQTKAVVDAGAIDPLIDFLTCPIPQLRRQAVFCLANVGGSIPQYRIMLARHPKFFSSMFESAELAVDSKVLELICWNLRNVCLLGGPTFSDVKIGVDFLFNKIIKPYWSYSHWQTCVRFALETVCTACRDEEGREFLIQQNITDQVLKILERDHLPLYQCTSGFEILAWVVAHGRDVDIEAFVRHNQVMERLMLRAIPGEFGAVIQELALKCLVVIAAHPSPDGLLHIFNCHEELFDMCGRLSMGLPPILHPNSENQPFCLPLTPTSTSMVKECAGYIFAKCCLLTPHIPTLLMKILVINDVISLLLDIVESGADQIQHKHLNNSATDFINGQNSSSSSHSGPPLSKILAELAPIGLKALYSLIEEGVRVATSERLPENPVLRMCVDSNSIERLRKVLNSTALPQDAFELGNLLLHGMIAAT